jgi:hypothetical protein
MVLIVPCAGRSTRFGLNKPKFLLTHPDGKLMIQKSLEGIDLKQFERIIITIVDDQITGYDSELILKQVFSDEEVFKFEICVLADYTNSQSETVHKTLLKMKITGSFAVKDSDNKIEVIEAFDVNKNFVVGLNINEIGQDINRLQSKSFLKVNTHGIITNIVEKKVISENICVGFYVFRDHKSYINSYSELSTVSSNELYLSHIISHLILIKKEVFELKNTMVFEDYGTKEDWKIIQLNHRTYFVDFDGVLVQNKGKFGLENWSTNDIGIQRNLEILAVLSKSGSQIIITTSRPTAFETSIRLFMESYGVKTHSIVCGLNHSQRILINDFAETNPYPSALGISIKRNGNLDEYLS